MDTKNVIAAISLSAAVIILYSLFFAPSPQELKQVQEDKNQTIQSTDAPSLEIEEKVLEISRGAAKSKSQRIEFENNSIIGSISLKGALIDDLIFKKYTETLDGNDQVILLNPRNLNNGYYVETGWATNSENIDVPNSNTIWKIIGNNKLTPNSPISLSWKNNQGIIFIKKISLDNEYLFIVNQTIKNTTEKKYNFYPYGQIIRNTAPEVTNFYILHEGLLGVFDDQLVEQDYDDIEEKKYSVNASKGWLGITDKYWIASLVPEKNKEFKADFEFKNKFKANFIESKPTVVGANETKSNSMKIIVAAKEVSVIDGYAEKLGIDKFDLAIDWGWFYFIVKPLFFAIDYFFKFSGNFGIAIVLITFCIRLAFFPLANYSFRSMAKMKVLQPELKRLTELHTEDMV